MRKWNRIKVVFLLASVVNLSVQAGNTDKSIHQAAEWHVAVTGNDTNSGSSVSPFRSIQTAAGKAMPGDIITVHAGVYRERVAPPRGGSSSEQPIAYRAAAGEKVEIKGSEVIKEWRKLSKKTWEIALPNSFFGDFNPYADTIHGDWLERGKWCHTGEVYLNNSPLVETTCLEKVLLNQTSAPLWYCKVDKDSTYIWANFAVDPNSELVEINVRQSVFYPKEPFINYITVSGFHISQAATPWAPPTAEQIGALGTHWSKGWIIENNTVSHSKCVGITLGKYGDEWDNKAESVDGYIKTTQRALDNKWNKENIGSHLIRNNHIHQCGQAGIAGSLGAIFSTVSDNVIHDIGCQNLFWGYELAGLKLHGAVDVLISHNHIYNTEGGIWLDWMTQGTRVTGNLLHDNRVQDFSLEVNHGPILVDNNLFLSPELAQVKLSQGVAFVHNIIAWKIWPTGKVDERKTPYLVPHGTQIAGFHDCPCGDVSYLNNVFTREDLSVYGECELPVQLEGNVVDSTVVYKIVQEDDGWYLEFTPSENYYDHKRGNPIHLEQLPIAIIPNQPFHEKGKSFGFDKDFVNRKRSKSAPYPGAFEWKGKGVQKIRVFDNIL